MDLTGYLTINGTDVWTEYGAFLGETEEGGHVNMDALLRMPKAKDITTVDFMPKAKDITTVDFRERNGVELPQNPNVKLGSIERTLQFWLRGSSAADRLDKYQRMMKLITSERNGVELPQNPNVKLGSIERTLQFWLRGSSAADRLDKYQRMMKLITSGMLTINVKNYRTYNMVYLDMPAEPDWYESYERDRFYVLFSVKFLEPQPSV